jgi:hypothetical protein
VGTAAQTSITSLGTLGSLVVTANVLGGNINTGGQVSAAGNATAANLGTTGLVTATGNVTGGNLNTAGLVSVGTTVSATGNITGGNIRTGGVISATGSITGDNLTVANTVITGNLTVSGTTAFTNVSTMAIQDSIISIGRGANNAALLSNDTKDRGEQLFYFDTAEKSAFIGYLNGSGKLVAATAATVTNKLVTVNTYGSFVVGQLEGATVSVTGNVTGGNLTTGGQVSATGNVTGGNIRTGGQERATGNVTGNILLGTLGTAAQPNITSLGALTSLIIPVSASDPVSPATGQMYYSTAIGGLKIWTGSVWDSII